MKNTLKALAALIAAMMMLSSAAALAEEVAVSEEFPATEEIVEIVEAPVAEEAAPEIVEAPVAEEAAPEIVEAPVAEEAAPEIIETPAEEEIVRTANIRLASSAEVDFGSTIKLVAELDGFEGTAYSLQWQIDNGSGWQNINGASGSSYSFELTESNMDATFRVLVTL